MQPSWPSEYIAGIEHFNAGNFYAAHEAWEEYWKVHSGSGNDFYKGLIQVAIGLLHWERGNPQGARKLWATGRSYLQKYMPQHNGIALDQWLGKVDALFNSWAPNWSPGDDCPPLNKQSIPKINIT